MSVETIARRYGSALADVVVKAGEADSVKRELLEWERIISANSALHEVMSNPAITHSQKGRVLEGLIGKARPSQTTANFLRVLLRNGRLTQLSLINERFAAELEDRGGVVSADVVSARQLPEAERSELQAHLEKLTGKKVKLNFNIDEELIGGVVTRLGSTVYDGSVKTQLENLREQLVNG